MEMEPRESQNRKPVRVWRMESCHHSQSFWLVVSFSLSSFLNHYLPIWVALPFSVYLTYSFQLKHEKGQTANKVLRAKIWLICKLDNCSSSWSWVIECSAASCVQWMDWVHRLPHMLWEKDCLPSGLFVLGRQVREWAILQLPFAMWWMKELTWQFDFVEGRQ